ncbi:hypothetical protein Plhal304r1_c003g0011071 [Plasmopara halstedii]
MLESASWSTIVSKPPLSKPGSANLSKRINTIRSKEVSESLSDVESYENQDKEISEIGDGDRDKSTEEKPHEVQTKLKVKFRQTYRDAYGKSNPSDVKFRSKIKFRPSSAPAKRPMSALTIHPSQSNDDKHQRSSASISIAYLRAASEKKKARDRDFARQLSREESDFKKKILAKIEQANKLTATLGSSKSFSPAPDRSGSHMVKVVDPLGGNRMISVETFYILYRFLASVPLGHTMQQHVLNSNNGNDESHTSKPGTKSSLKNRRLSSRTTQSIARPFSASRESVHPQPAKGRSDERSQVQEELRSVLEGTIMLTKILQEQIHELKLKGWNVAPRS